MVTTTPTRRQPTSTFLVFETTDETGTNIDVGFLVTVTDPPRHRRRSSGCVPIGVTPGEMAGETTGSDGRVAFEWEPDDTVADPAAWAVDA